MVRELPPVTPIAVVPVPVLVNLPMTKLASIVEVDAGKLRFAPEGGTPTGFQFAGVLQLGFPPRPVHVWALALPAARNARTGRIKPALRALTT